MNVSDGAGLLKGVEFITVLADTTEKLRDCGLSVLPISVQRALYDDGPLDDDELDAKRPGRPTSSGTFVVEYFVEAIAIFLSEERALGRLAETCRRYGSLFSEAEPSIAKLIVDLGNRIAAYRDFLKAQIPRIQEFLPVSRKANGIRLRLTSVKQDLQ